MATETLTITKLEVVNNYLKVSGDLGVPKVSTRAVEYFYPKVSTNFAKGEKVTEVGGKVLIENFYSISNHMTGGKCVIPELLIGNITDGKTAFTVSTFVEFCTLNTGA